MTVVETMPMPTIAPLDRRTLSSFGADVLVVSAGLVDVDVEVDVDVRDVVTETDAVVETVADPVADSSTAVPVAVPKLVVTDPNGIALILSPPEIKLLALSSSPLNRAPLSDFPGQLPIAHGFCPQHPRKGGVVPVHVYHLTSGSVETHSCAGILSNASASKEAARRSEVGQSPVVVLQGSDVQQPMNWVGLEEQM